MYDFNLTEEAKIVEALMPATDAAGRTSPYITLKNAGVAYIICHITQGAANTIALNILQGTNVAGAGSKALANPIPIWADLDTGASDNLVRQTDAVNFTTDAAIKNKIVVFQLDPALLDVANGYRTIAIQTGASNVANITQAEFILGDLRYAQAVGLTVKVD
jgi:hypothetical protein